MLLSMRKSYQHWNKEIPSLNADNYKALQSENESLKATVSFLETRMQNAERAYDQLLYEMKQLARARFGSQSERFIDPEHPQQSLFLKENVKNIDK